MSFDSTMLQVLTELGIAGFSLYIFYSLITKQNENHREDRKHDSELWRTELKERGEKSDEVIKELTSVIKEIKYSNNSSNKSE